MYKRGLWENQLDICGPVETFMCTLQQDADLTDECAFCNVMAHCPLSEKIDIALSALWDENPTN